MRLDCFVALGRPPQRTDLYASSAGLRAPRIQAAYAASHASQLRGAARYEPAFRRVKNDETAPARETFRPHGPRRARGSGHRRGDGSVLTLIRGAPPPR